MKSAMLPSEEVRGIIILEGPDGGGKSTLAKALVDRYGAKYLHGRYYPTQAFARHTAMLRIAAHESQRRLVVVDRHWISENIYGSTFHGGSVHGALTRLFVRQWLRFGALYIFCLPPTGTVEKNYLERQAKGGEFYDSVVEVNERYRRLWAGEDDVCPVDPDYVDQLTRAGGVAKNPTRFMDYDYRHWPNVGPMSPLITGIAWKLETLRRYTWAPGFDVSFDNIAGNAQSAKVMFVGSRLRNDGQRAILWPYWSNSGQASYLCRALHSLGVDEEDICFTCFDQAGFEEHIFDGLWSERKMRIVALGKAIGEVLKTYGITPDAVVPAPYQAKRTGYRNEQYEMELDKALGPEVRRL